jgi:hypothetical protein
MVAVQIGDYMKIETDRAETMEPVYSCDLCGRISKHRITCSICNIDICSHCTFFDPRPDVEYQEKYCTSCFNIGKEYFDKMEEEKEKFDVLMEDIEQEWKDKAIEAANLANNKGCVL